MDKNFAGILRYFKNKKGKRSERLDFIVPFFKDLSKIFVVMTLPIILTDFLATRVNLVSKAIALYFNSEL